jgi:hypothetical protein
MQGGELSWPCRRSIPKFLEGLAKIVKLSTRVSWRAGRDVKVALKTKLTEQQPFLGEVSGNFCG